MRLALAEARAGARHARRARSGRSWSTARGASSPRGRNEREQHERSRPRTPRSLAIREAAEATRRLAPHRLHPRRHARAVRDVRGRDPRRPHPHASCSARGTRRPAPPARVYDVLRDRRLNHRVEVFGGVEAEASARLLLDFFDDPLRRPSSTPCRAVDRAGASAPYRDLGAPALYRGRGPRDRSRGLDTLLRRSSTDEGRTTTPQTPRGRRGPRGTRRAGERMPLASAARTSARCARSCSAAEPVLGQLVAPGVAASPRGSRRRPRGGTAPRAASRPARRPGSRTAPTPASRSTPSGRSKVSPCHCTVGHAGEVPHGRVGAGLGRLDREPADLLALALVDAGRRASSRAAARRGTRRRSAPRRRCACAAVRSRRRGRGSGRSRRRPRRRRARRPGRVRGRRAPRHPVDGASTVTIS